MTSAVCTAANNPAGQHSQPCLHHSFALLILGREAAVLAALRYAFDVGGADVCQVTQGGALLPKVGDKEGTELLHLHFLFYHVYHEHTRRRYPRQQKPSISILSTLSAVSPQSSHRQLLTSPVRASSGL